MKKTTVKAPANIAFIKYWGKADPKTRVPANNSISMCLSNLYSLCTVEFSPKYHQDEFVFLDEKVVLDEEKTRVLEVLDRVRKLAGTQVKAKVVSKNNFPKATGIASSASGLSSVTMAALGSLEIYLNEKELSKMARFASGTACRSIPSGFVEWKRGTSEANSYSVSLFPKNHWQICDLVAVVTHEMKKVSSTEGHKIADTSPFYQARLKAMPAKIKALKAALKNKNFTKFGQISETEALNMHAICLTSTPMVWYFNTSTLEIIRQIIELREDNKIESYFTIDAGPTVHVICQEKDASKLKSILEKINGVSQVSLNYPADGAKYIQDHLF